MKVVFVCTGNMCRSPMLKFAFEHYLKDIGISGVTVDSAGLMHHQKPMTENAAVVLDRHGIAHGENISKYCDESVLNGSDYVIAVTADHARKLKEIYGDKYNVVAMYDVIGQDIFDPYGLGLAAYEEVYYIIENAMPQIYAYINK